MIKLLAVDMDGTCLDSRSRMTDATLDALRSAANHGILVVPTTGRALTCLPHRLAAARNLYRYVISSNGARVTDLDTKKSVYTADIPRKTALSLLAELPRGLGVTSHLDHQYLIQGRLLLQMGRMIYGRDAREARRVRDMSAFLRDQDHSVEELQLFFFSPGARGRVEQALARYPQLSAAYSGMYVEIYAKTASKGTALAALARSLGLDRSEIACVGDGENDLSMFAAAGLRFAMGNAVEALKAQADLVLPSNDQDGVAAAVNHILS